MAEVKAAAELFGDKGKLELPVGRKLDAGVLHLLDYGEELLYGLFQLFRLRSADHRLARYLHQHLQQLCRCLAGQEVWHGHGHPVVLPADAEVGVEGEREGGSE